MMYLDIAAVVGSSVSLLFALVYKMGPTAAFGDWKNDNRVNVLLLLLTWVSVTALLLNVERAYLLLDLWKFGIVVAVGFGMIVAGLLSVDAREWRWEMSCETFPTLRI